MTTENLKYNILVIDDDPLVLEDVVLMYKDMIFLGDFDDILGKGASGSVSAAKNTKEAERALRGNFEKDPKLVQLLHVDERMPEERGSEFVDRMRWAYAGRRIGALLVTGYATDVSVINSREKGVYRYVSKPVTPGIIKPHLDDLVKVIFSKEKPKRREITDTFVFKQITDKEQLRQYFQLRYSVFDFMNYLQQKNERRLDIDKFDPYSIPYGGFVVNGDSSETIVATIRTITTEVQEPYNQMIQEISGGRIPISLIDRSINTGVVDSLGSFVEIKRRADFLVAEALDIEHVLRNYRKQGARYGEYSRIIDHPDYRGYGLSKSAILLAITHSLINGISVIFGQCDLRHEAMYAKYGWRRLPDMDIFLENKVQNITVAMVQDVKKDLPPEVQRQVHSQFLGKLSKDRYLCFCPNGDCYAEQEGYEADQSDGCPLKGYSV